MLSHIWHLKYIVSPFVCLQLVTLKQSLFIMFMIKNIHIANLIYNMAQTLDFA